eukprot:SAG11_NODE_11698_length_743_cov_1.349379_2_plen_104_part_01
MEIVNFMAQNHASGLTKTAAKDARGADVVKLGNKKESKAAPGSPAAFFDAVLNEDFAEMEALLEEYPEYLNIRDDLVRRPLHVRFPLLRPCTGGPIPARRRTRS